MLRSLTAFALLGIATIHCGPATPPAYEWRVYGSDAASTKFAPLTQIDSTNFDDLRVIWRWHARDRKLARAHNVENYMHNRSTPIVINGILYTSTPLNHIVALDAATGEELWLFDPEAWKVKGWVGHRGVAYWNDGDHARIIFGTSSAYLYSLDANTGLPDPDFGVGGRVDLTKGMYRDVERENYGVLSPPTICKNVIVVGSSIVDYTHHAPHPEFAEPGDVRGFDVRTGEQLWDFHMIPQEGEFGNDTWENDSWKRYGAGNVWSFISADDDLGYVYLPTSSVSADTYGGERPGDNLFGESLVCLDVRTGERVWHYQIVHHGLWDYDLSAAPILLDIVVDGKPIKAVAQLTKQAFCFVFDRVTGEPVWPIEERPVPPSKLEGESASPTQPFPTRPAPFNQQGVHEDSLIDFTPQLRQRALERISGHDYGPLYTPPSERGTVVIPGGAGASGWVGAAAHPGKGWIYVPSHNGATLIRVTRQLDPNSFTRYRGHGQDEPNIDGLEITKPPYGRITAIDLNTGDHVWMRPMGKGPVDHPLLKDLNLPDLGWNTRYFPIATPNLLFVASESATSFNRQPYDVDPERYLWALSLEDGHTLGRVDLPGNAYGQPITYMAGGRQYVALPIGTWREGADFVALAIPEAGEQLAPNVYGREDSDHPRYYDAVAAFEAGDVDSLSALLKNHKDLTAASGYLSENYSYESFRGATLLHRFVGNPDGSQMPDTTAAMVGLLLTSGAEPNATTLDSSSAMKLLLDSRRNNFKQELAALLLKAGADAHNGDGYPMAATALHGDEELSQLLLDHGARSELRFAAALNRVVEMASYFNKDGSLVEAVADGFRFGAPPWAKPSAPTRQFFLNEALHAAAGTGAVEAAEFLVEPVPTSTLSCHGSQGSGMMAHGRSTKP